MKKKKNEKFVQKIKERGKRVWLFELVLICFCAKLCYFFVCLEGEKKQSRHRDVAKLKLMTDFFARNRTKICFFLFNFTLACLQGMQSICHHWIHVKKIARKWINKKSDKKKIANYFVFENKGAIQKSGKSHFGFFPKRHWPESKKPIDSKGFWWSQLVLPDY